jgi:hypothetical protein
MGNPSASLGEVRHDAHIVVLGVVQFRQPATVRMRRIDPLQLARLVHTQAV